MIAREWKCRCPVSRGDGFLRHLYATGVAETSGTPGFLGYQILTRQVDDALEVTLTTYWEALEAIAAFAGADIDAAVLYPGDEALDIAPERVVRHYEVVGAGFPLRSTTLP
jgi:heme-degrading monooxygenase HmoA